MSASTYAKAALTALRRGPQKAAAPARTVTEEHRIVPAEWARFQRVTSGPVGNSVSPAYLHTLGFLPSLELMADSQFPLPVLGMVHVYNRFELLAPVWVGDELTVETSVSAPRRHPKGAVVDIRVTGRRGGAPVFEETSVYLAKGAELIDADEGEAIPRIEWQADSLPTAQWKLDPAIGRSYAAVSGDRNPIHLSGVAAKAFGFPRRIAHGMYTAARALNATDVASETYVWEIQFAKPLLLPSTVDFSLQRAGESVTTAVTRKSDGAPHAPDGVSFEIT